MHHLAISASAPAVVPRASVRRDRVKPAKLASFASRRQQFTAQDNNGRHRSLIRAKAEEKDALDDVASGYSDAGPSLSDIQALMDAAARGDAWPRGER